MQLQKKVVVLGIILREKLVSTCIGKQGFSCILDILRTTKSFQKPGNSFSSFT